MKRRGRPPHPDVLTPREWDVLTLVREGLTNPQIAERLGISFDAAKYHVAEILSKLGLETREEAAAWQPEPPERQVLRPAWARALGPIAGLWRAWPIAARIAGAAVVAAAVAGLGVLLYGVLRSSGDDDSNIAQATTSGSPAATTPTAMAVLPAITLPPNLDIVMEVGCCETPFTGLIRANGENEGAGARKVLFSAGSHSFNTADGSFDSRDEYRANGVTVPTPNPQAPGKAPAEDRPYVATYGVSADSQAMVVGLCIRGSCEGVNAAPNDQGITQLYRSLDAGDTWSELMQLGPYVRVVGVTGAGRTLVSTTLPGQKDQTYAWEPDGEAVTPPVLVAAEPTVLLDGRSIWPANGNWYLQDGSILARNVPANDAFSPILDLGDGQFAISTEKGFAIIADGAISATYSAPGVSAYLGNGVFVGMTSGAAPAGSDLVTAAVPALIDINARTVTPITSPFLDVGFDSPQPGFLILVGAFLIKTPPSGL